MSRAASVAGLGFGLASLATWIANALEIEVFRPHACSLQRMQFESWLFLARAAAIVMPVIGLLLALVAVHAPPSLRRAGIAANSVAILLVAAMFLGLVPMGHLPCLRD